MIFMIAMIGSEQGGQRRGASVSVPLVASLRGAMDSSSQTILGRVWKFIKGAVGVVYDVVIVGLYASGLILLGMGLWNRFGGEGQLKRKTRRGPELVAA